jgi:hypothetical protein
MSSIPIPVWDLPKLHGMEIRPFSLEEYHRMVELGIVAEDNHYEFIEGYLVAKDQGRGPAKGHAPPHATCVSMIAAFFVQAFAGLCTVRFQFPVTLPASCGVASGSEPEPDLVVADGPSNRYCDRHPGPAEIRLLAEAADSSLKYDRQVKGRLYASCGIGLYWIVNIADRQLEIYTDPDSLAGRYRSKEVLPQDRFVVLSFPGLPPLTIRVRDLLP